MRLPAMPPTYRRHPNTAGRIVDGLAFVVTADDNKLHTLNATATHVWQLAQGGVDLETAAHALTESFQVELPTARADLAACLDDLVARQILVLG